jgi:tRNA(fMet)-specific endonuclease VapC
VIALHKIVLLDTNVLVEIIRGSSLAEWIEAKYQLSSRPERPLISIVTVGEILALAKKFGWGDEKTRNLHDLIRQYVTVDISALTIIDFYAQISYHLESTGQKIPQNDMWIAATAAAAQAVLLTLDKHLDRLTSVFIEIEWIDPKGHYPPTEANPAPEMD